MKLGQEVNRGVREMAGFQATQDQHYRDCAVRE